MAMDLVCGMTVNEKTAQHKSEHGGETYYFCSPGCKRSFEKDPQKYIAQAGSATGGMHHGG